MNTRRPKKTKMEKRRPKDFIQFIYDAETDIKLAKAFFISNDLETFFKGKYDITSTDCIDIQKIKNRTEGMCVHNGTIECPAKGY